MLRESVFFCIAPSVLTTFMRVFAKPGRKSRVPGVCSTCVCVMLRVYILFWYNCWISEFQNVVDVFCDVFLWSIKIV